jgi:arsenate reductase
LLLIGGAYQGDGAFMAVRAMREGFQIDISQHVPKVVDRVAHEYFDYVITVCADAAKNSPTFSEHTERIHWDMPDPVLVEGTLDEQQRAFDVSAAELDDRLRLWLSLPSVVTRLSGWSEQ